jgi:hypothetical protein
VDLNYFYKRHEVSVFMAEEGGCVEGRRADSELADACAARAYAVADKFDDDAR